MKEKGDEIRDCNYDRDTGFGDFNRRESGNVALKETEIREFQRLKYASDNSIRQISEFVLLLMLMLMSRVFSLAYAYVMLMLVLMLMR